MESSNRRSGLTSRRTFLQCAAGLAASPYIVPASVFGQTAPSNLTTIGVIGVGGRGRRHISGGYANSKQGRVLAVCDVNAQNTEKAKSLVDQVYGDSGCAVYGDFRELLARDDIDAVSIAVPDHWHALIAVAAARAGKHIYSEKPLAYTYAEGKAMVDAVHEHGVVFQHGTQQRSMPSFRHACMLARNGRLGKLHTIRVGSPFGLRGGSTEQTPPPEGLNYEFWLGPAPYTPYTPGRCDGGGGEGWYQIRDYSGGWITAWGSHDVDIAQWGHGTDDTGPVEVVGHAEYPTEGVYSTAWKWHMECTYADGVKLIYASEDENPHGVKFEGSDGWVFVNREKLEAEPASLLEEPFGPDDVQLIVSDNHMENFLDAIRTGAPLAAPIEVAHRSTTICHLCNIAGYLGRTLRWDPATERFKDDDMANWMLSRAMRGPWRL